MAAFLNNKTGEINFKITYYGPGLSGKTTNLQYIYQETRPELRTEMYRMATESEPMLFFSLVPRSLPPIAGLVPRFHLFTVPGAVFDGVSRRLSLRAADGVVFVADSQVERSEGNAHSWVEFERDMAALGQDLRQTPLIMQYNKRDLPNAMPVAELDALLGSVECPRFEAAAHMGLGVFETLNAVVRAIHTRHSKKLGSSPSAR